MPRIPSYTFDRLAKQRVVFVNRFLEGEREHLEKMAIAHGATIAKELGPDTHYLVVPSTLSSQAP